MTHIEKKNQRAPGQGALEYLLLIGGAVLVATIVMVLIITQVGPSTEGIINTNLNEYQNRISLGGSGGGNPPATCGNNALDSGEDCDVVASVVTFQGGNADCSAWGAFQSGTNVTCNASTCAVNTSAGTPIPGADTTPPVWNSFSAVAGDGQVSVSYDAADPAPGTPPVLYRIAYSDTSDLVTAMTLSQYVTPNIPAGVTVVDGTGSPQTISSLTNGTTYFFNSRACDNVSSTPNCSVYGTAVSATPTSGAVTFSGLTASVPIST